MANSSYSKRVLEIAAMLDVPKTTVDKIRKIKNQRPDLLEKIQAGELNFNAAEHIIWEGKQVIIFPLLNMEEAAIRLAKAYESGAIGRPDFDEFIDYLEIELSKVDKKVYQELCDRRKATHNQI